MLYLDKILSQLIYPLGLSLLLALLALLFILLRRQLVAAGILLLAIGWLGLWSLPVVSDAIRLSLENRFPNQLADELPVVDAIVVLGGSIRPVPADWPYPDLNQAADRVWHAARLYHAGKASRIIVSGGMLSWQGDYGSEADAMREFLLDLGVPESAILLETRSRNTRENALFSAELSGAQSILLVTSALHMRRALAVFRAVGLDVVPAATDFEVIPERNHPLRWLPDAKALDGSARALKEYLGLWVYRWRGWAQ